MEIVVPQARKAASRRAIVIGGSVAGLFAAIFLRQSGWSVVVTGRAARVTDPELIARYRKVPLVPWAPGERDQFVTITTEVVEGRRVSRAAGSTDPGRGQPDPARGRRRG